MQTDLAALNERFGLTGHVVFQEGPGGLAMALVSNDRAEAMIALQGAHVMTFQPRGQQPVLWLSQFAKFAPGKSIRGGVPVCWPWFGAHATDSAKPAHGYARTVMWDVQETEVLADGATRLRFQLQETEGTSGMGPQGLEAELVVTVGDMLAVDLVTRNGGTEVAELGEALHTYFHISDVDQVRITGLEGCDYLDKVEDFTRRTQTEAVTIGAEVDRVYLDTEAECVIEDRGLNRRIRVAKSGSRSTVVWNPWTEKAEKMGDFGPEGYRGMVCVETANAASNVVTLAPGETHVLSTIIRSEPL